jgi:D-alanyl-D-alanine carboxypeptidase
VDFASGDRAGRFHAASVGKMMTATLAFQLAESGRLNLDAPLPSLLPEGDFSRLFVHRGQDLAADVTPMHLLTHMSGAADYFGGPNDTRESFTQRVTRNPSQIYAPLDLLAFSRAHQRPVGAPGEGFHYSDTGYVLLGRVIEEAGGSSLGDQLHERILQPAGMNESCLMFHTLPGGRTSIDPDPGAALGIAPIYVDGVDLSRARSLSCDWGGGGVVTTLDDLQRFAAAWHRGELIGAESRARMTHAPHRFRAGIRYGAGVMQLRYPEFFPLLRGLPRTIGHLGVTGVHLFTDPERHITLVLNLHSSREMTRSFQLHIRLLQAVLSTLRKNAEMRRPRR